MKLLHTLRGKLMAVILSTTLSALFVAGGVILIYDINSFRAAMIDDMTTQAELLSFSTGPALQFNDKSVALQGLNLLQIRPAVRAAAIYDQNGEVFASYTSTGEAGDFPVRPRPGVTITESGLEIARPITQNNQLLGVAYIRSDYQLVERITSFIGILGLVALAAMLVAVPISIWLQSKISGPVNSIVAVAQSVIAHKDYSHRAQKLTEDEIGVLVTAFNNMLDEIQQRTRALENTNLNLEHARQEVMELNEELEEKVRERTRQLELTNQELESFSYSVSHDLRAPLRAINGFSQTLADSLPEGLPEKSRFYIERITAATARMGQLIDDLMKLSRVSQGDLEYQQVNLSRMADEVMKDLRNVEPRTGATVNIQAGMTVRGDPKLLRIVLDNLLSNAWKFTSKQDSTVIEVGQRRDNGDKVYFVRDNGAGFDMAYADQLFNPFKRLHSKSEYPGSGVGLATVQRVIQRHGGRIWSESSPGKGAVFYFTLDSKPTAESDK